MQILDQYIKFINSEHDKEKILLELQELFSSYIGMPNNQQTIHMMRSDFENILYNTSDVTIPIHISNVFDNITINARDSLWN
jgi:hypothetical protein